MAIARFLTLRTTTSHGLSVCYPQAPSSQRSLFPRWIRALRARVPALRLAIQRSMFSRSKLLTPIIGLESLGSHTCAPAAECYRVSIPKPAVGTSPWIRYYTLCCTPLYPIILENRHVASMPAQTGPLQPRYHGDLPPRTTLAVTMLLSYGDHMHCSDAYGSLLLLISYRLDKARLWMSLRNISL